MGVTVNDLVVYHYEKQPSDYKAGELLHNFNGNDYRVMENYGGGNLLLMQMNTGMMVVGGGSGYLYEISEGRGAYAGEYPDRH